MSASDTPPRGASGPAMAYTVIFQLEGTTSSPPSALDELLFVPVTEQMKLHGPEVQPHFFC